jgi:hypothetical protein
MGVGPTAFAGEVSSLLSACEYMHSARSGEGAALVALMALDSCLGSLILIKAILSSVAWSGRSGWRG